jgi:hypothetical protein
VSSRLEDIMEIILGLGALFVVGAGIFGIMEGSINGK